MSHPRHLPNDDTRWIWLEDLRKELDYRRRRRERDARRLDRHDSIVLSCQIVSILTTVLGIALAVIIAASDGKVALGLAPGAGAAIAAAFMAPLRARNRTIEQRRTALNEEESRDASCRETMTSIMLMEDSDARTQKFSELATQYISTIGFNSHATPERGPGRHVK
jgi:hypothetical protein